MINKFNHVYNFRERLGSRQRFYLYCFALGFIGLTDAVVSYYFPIVAEPVFGSNFAVGLLIGLANLIALMCDLLFPEVLKKKTWKFFLLGAVLLQIGFPAFTFLGVITSFGVLFVVAVVFWNIYFELMAFSRHNFIIHNEKKENFSRDWGMVSVIMGFMAIIGPIIGSQVAKSPITESITTVAFIQAIAIAACLLVVAVSPNNYEKHELKNRLTVKISVLREMKLWQILGARILPIVILGSMTSLISAAVLTVGGLLGKQILGQYDLDWMLIFMFSVPAVFSSLFLTRIVFKKYKKLISQFLLILAALPLIALPIVRDQPWLVITIFFFCSFFVSMAWILNEAVFSDLSRRAGKDNLYVNAIERANDSIGCLMGPILIGFLADKTDYFWAFSIIGLLITLVALLLIVLTPRKILIPHQELEKVESLT